MLAVRVHRPGGPEVLQTEAIPPPVPGSGEVLVSMRASALNHLDLWVRGGLPGIVFPVIMGSDGAGVVVAVGSEVEGVATGQEVVIQPGTFCGRCEFCRAGRENLCPEYGILGESQDGVQAQLVAVKPENLGAKPAYLSFEEAASFTLVFLTAYQMLIKRARLQAGETVLAVAGSSGVGAAAIQIAADAGARVIATASTGVKTDFAREMGAEEVVDHYAPEWYQRVLELTGSSGVDVVVEHVGVATWKQSIRAMAPGARLVTCGATTGSSVSIDLRHAFRRHHSFLGSTMGDLDTFHAVLNGFAERRYRPFVDRVFPLEQIAEAHRYLEDRRHQGKVVISIPIDGV